LLDVNDVWIAMAVDAIIAERAQKKLPERAKSAGEKD
jgi:hypothetical protein